MRMPHRVTTAVAALVLAGASAGTALATECQRDEAFLKNFHRGNEAQIAAGKDAMRNAVYRCTRDAGKMMVMNHEKIDRIIRDIAHRQDVSLPTDIPAEQQAALKTLRANARTKTYDKMWLAAEEVGHMQTMTLLDDEISNGQDPASRDAARDARPVVARHLDVIHKCMKKADPSKRDTAKKDPVKMAPAKKGSGKKGAGKKGTNKMSPAKKSPAKKDAVKKDPAKKIRVKELTAAGPADPQQATTSEAATPEAGTPDMTGNDVAKLSAHHHHHKGHKNKRH
ncbi:DUF4142 domain-containing protein [Streptoverticillium reticulum]|uniref:DUF4142 domain-containing protein n=1 Tax=Streptomyces TaxID=1883 RepID=UPI00369C72F6